MRNYESIFILNPESSDEAIDAEISKITELLKQENTEISHVEKWGKRRLAYLVKKQKYGIYVLIRFSGEPELVTKLDHLYRFRDGIIKFQTIWLTGKAQKAALSGSYLESKPVRDYDRDEDEDSRREDQRKPREEKEVSLESSDG